MRGPDSFSRNAQTASTKTAPVAAVPLDRVLPPCPLIPFSHHARSEHTRARTHARTRRHDVPTDIGRRRRAILVHEFLSVDVTQALEEGQRAECVGVSDLHVARHSLDHTHEALQFRHDVIWGHKRGSDGGKFALKGSNLQLRHPDELFMQTSQRAPQRVSFVMCGDQRVSRPVSAELINGIVA